MRLSRRGGKDNENIEEIVDLCNTHLAYLNDADITIDINYLDRSDCIVVRLQKRFFLWVDVKDHIIPLLIQLSKRHMVEEVTFYIVHPTIRDLSGYYDIAVSEIISETNENLEKSKFIGSISFYISK